MHPFTYHDQKDAYTSPWGFKHKVKMLLWEYVWWVFCWWTPKPLNGWRKFWLRLFGAKIYGNPFIHQRTRIAFPWNLTIHDRACVGDRANLYSLGEIELGEDCTVAQESYLCTGTHDIEKTFSLMTAKITIGAHAFLAARTFVMPGVTIGEDAVIGACSVVTKDMPAGMLCAGSPCKPIRPRRPNKAV
jgi:putative colanic acid biosynthesis acetyltransferase WcaF